LQFLKLPQLLSFQFEHRNAALQRKRTRLECCQSLLFLCELLPMSLAFCCTLLLLQGCQLQLRLSQLLAYICKLKLLRVDPWGWLLLEFAP